MRRRAMPVADYLRVASARARPRGRVRSGRRRAADKAHPRCDQTRGATAERASRLRRYRSVGTDEPREGLSGRHTLARVVMLFLFFFSAARCLGGRLGRRGAEYREIRRNINLQVTGGGYRRARGTCSPQLACDVVLDHSGRYTRAFRTTNNTGVGEPAIACSMAAVMG